MCGFQDLPTSRGITLRVADGSLAPLHVFLDETSPAKNVKVRMGLGGGLGLEVLGSETDQLAMSP